MVAPWRCSRASAQISGRRRRGSTSLLLVLPQFSSAPRFARPPFDVKAANRQNVALSSCTTERTACQAPCPRAKWDTAVLVSALEIQGPHHGPEGTALGEIFSEG